MNEQITFQKALYTIKKLKHVLAQQKSAEPIAIIGLSCRFPNAVGKQAYWEMLKEGKNIISKMPENRWELLNGTDETLLRDHEHPYWGGFLTDIDHFDAYFFGISPREAIRIDPQHRLLLEVAHEAIEDAGISHDAISGTKTGVFASLYVSQLAHLQKMDAEMDALYLPTGNAISIAANRLSYLLDLRGPSIIIDSACSSSMTSLNLACLNLQTNACDLALVCGAKLNLLPYVNYVLSKAKMLSPDGQCKTFDASANGYVQGEGVGVIVLKPLAKALRDKDRIYAVVVGSAINQDGRTNGLTAPNGLQQELLLRSSYAAADVDPNDISYIECHGTGTFLGDPIEIQALGEVVGKKRQEQAPCWIGSVKTNIGHLEPAAGIASIIKVALALKNKQIPPHLNFNTPNPHIAFDRYHLKVPTELQEWPRYNEVRVAGLSGFGFGGANAHVVMRELSDAEQETVAQAIPMEKEQELFTISAKNETALSQLVERWLNHLEYNSALKLAEICYNSHLRRSHYSHRLAIIARSIEELKTFLKQVKNNSYQGNQNVHLGNEKTKSNLQSVNVLEMDLETLARYYTNQGKIDWQKYEEKRCYPVIDMPLYPWQPKKYWPPLGKKTKENVMIDSHPLQGKKLSSPLQSIQFEFKASSQLLPDLKDTYNILHAGYYLEILAFAAEKISDNQQFVIEEHKFISPLIAADNNLITIQLVLDPCVVSNYYNYCFYSCTNGAKNWVKNASGKLSLNSLALRKVENISDIKARCFINEPAESLYERVISMGMPAGESIRWTQQYWLGEKEILCEFSQPAVSRNNEQYCLTIHPSVIDASIQPLFRILPPQLIKPYIASGAKKICFYGGKHTQYYLWGILKNIINNDEKIVGECFLINERSEVVAHFEEVILTQLDNKVQIEKLMASQTKFTTDISSLSIDQRKQYILDFLIEQIAIVFSIPKEDISRDISLRDLGIDSLMALVLMRTIEVGLEVSYSMQDLLAGPTINELVDFLTGQKTSKLKEVTVSDSRSTRWITFQKHQTQRQFRLFCFPYGGGGASIYHEWQKHLPSTIEVCPIQLPGREERMDDKPFTNIVDLLTVLKDVLKNEIQMPFAFFGHSFGSLIAFELARHLRKSNMPMPSHIFISAFPDPRVPTSSLDRLLMQLKAINVSLSDIDNAVAIERLTMNQLQEITQIFNENGVIGYGDYFLDKDIIKVLLPIFVSDMSIVKSYQYYQEPPLNLPLTVFAGKKDQWVTFEDHLKWEEHTIKECNILAFDSGHMFIRDQTIRNEVLKTITETLLKEQSFESQEVLR